MLLVGFPHSLRYLNASANKLECLPPASLSEESFSSLQELYLTNNSLTDKSVPLLTGHAHLRVLHLAYNQLQTFPASKMARLEQLEELDLSGNRLRAVPTTILSCRHMHTLSAHSNNITVFPEVLQLQDMKVGHTQHTLSAHSNNITVFPEVLQLQDMKVGHTQHTISAHSNNITVFPEVLQLQDMKCVDLSCNELCEVVLPESLPAKLQELDLTGNPRLNLDHRSLELLNNIRCFRVDPSPSSLCGSEGPGEPAVWSHGYTEASGVNNKLCVAALALDSFCGSREALYGVFDGDRNVEVPYLLQCTMGDVLAEELHKSKNQEDYMTNTFLTMQRKLGTAGQRLGGSAALCHIRHGLVAPSDRGGGGCFTVTAANVGRCQAVLCRDGKALPLSTTHTVRQQSEYQRARQHHAIITEPIVRQSPELLPLERCSSTSIPPSPRPPATPQGPRPSRSDWLARRGLGGGGGATAAAVFSDTQLHHHSTPTVRTAVACATVHSFWLLLGSLGRYALPPLPRVDMRIHKPRLARMKTHPAGAGHTHPNTSVTQQPEPLPPPSCQSAPTPPSSPPHPFPDHQPSPDPSPDPVGEEELRAVETDTVTPKHTVQGQEVGPGETGAGLCLIGGEAQLGAGSGSSSASRTLGGTLGRKGRGNGSVACQGRSQDVIEEVGDAPVRKQGGYFNAPAQPDPDDKLVIPPELEEEIREIMKQQQVQSQTHPQSPPAAEYYVTPF
ncbi:PH domain leucine-rich repeat-containing protein phosphatase 1-like [Salvelinus sp. IW2-2015]|uniref:PH domain leucine-rich repeat-containing protein phosphatase 1-like n=1 Tax=Salvelinus sp. IW2-2015 TaxID=2691554 RepID=UPI0038D383DC